MIVSRAGPITVPRTVSSSIERTHELADLIELRRVDDLAKVALSADVPLHDLGLEIVDLMSDAVDPTIIQVILAQLYGKVFTRGTQTLV